LSQHPYAEQFIGEPYVYTININDSDEVRTTIQKILDMEHVRLSRARKYLMSLFDLMSDYGKSSL